MATTRSGGADVTATAYSEIIANATADCVIQNPSRHSVYLVFADTQPAADFKGGIHLLPGEVYMRTDTANTPVLQGKIWARADDNVNLSVTE